MRARLDSLKQAAGQGARADSIAALDAKIAALIGSGGGRFGGGRGGASQAPTLSSLNGQLGGYYGVLQGSDAAPTLQEVAAVAAAERTMTPLLARWDGLKREAEAVLGR